MHDECVCLKKVRQISRENAHGWPLINNRIAASLQDENAAAVCRYCKCGFGNKESLSLRLLTNEPEFRTDLLVGNGLDLSWIAVGYRR